MTMLNAYSFNHALFSRDDCFVACKRLKLPFHWSVILTDGSVFSEKIESAFDLFLEKSYKGVKVKVQVFPELLKLNEGNFVLRHIRECLWRYVSDISLMKQGAVNYFQSVGPEPPIIFKACLSDNTTQNSISHQFKRGSLVRRFKVRLTSNSEGVLYSTAGPIGY